MHTKFYCPWKIVIKRIFNYSLLHLELRAVNSIMVYKKQESVIYDMFSCRVNECFFGGKILNDLSLVTGGEEDVFLQ